MSRRTGTDAIPTRLLAVFLSIAMALGGVPTPALAEAAGTGAAAAADDAATARDYVQTNVVGASYFISNSTRGADGTFTLAAKTSGGYEVTDLVVNTSGDSAGTYMYGVTCDDAALSYYRLRSGKRWYFSVKDRPADKHVITLTLAVYAAGTAQSDITAGTATPITTIPVHVVLEPAPAKYQVSFQPTDSATGQAVAGAAVEAREGSSWGSLVSADSGTTYTLDSSKTYYVKATAAGYADATLQDFVPTESGSKVLQLSPKVADTYTASVTDAKTGEPVENATIKVTYPSGYSTATLSPQADGAYRLEQGVTYTVSASADGYAADSQKVTPAVTGTASTGTVPFSLVPQTYVNLSFRAVDPAGNAVASAGTPTVKDATSWNANVVAPQADGTYRLAAGTKASVTFTAAHYRSSAVSYTVTGDESAPVDITLTPKENVLSVRVLKAKATEDAGATVTVTHDEEDWYGDAETVTDSPNADGTYTLALPYSSWEDPVTYTITVKGSDGTTKTTTFTPSADSVEKTVTVKLYDDPDQKTADAAAAAIGDLYTLRPCYGTDKNINDYVAAKLGDAARGATISLAATDDAATIDKDGVIHYVTSAEDGKWSHVYSKNLDLTFAVTVGDCTATAKARATVGWDGAWFHQQMQAEADGLDVAALLGDNASADAVTEALELPGRTTTSIWDAYSAITWSAEPAGAVDVATGAVTRGSTDQTVTLTATFEPNDSLLNTNVDKAEAFGTVTRTYTVTVKADPQKVADETARLQQMLDAGFAYANVTDFGTGGAIAADGTGITGDLQLPTTRKFRDADGNRLDGKYYSVAYTVPEGTTAMTANGYRTNVVRPLGADATVPVTCTITSKANPAITASKTLDFMVPAVSEAEIDAELALMQEAEDGYKDALLNGQAEPVAKDLSTFRELYLAEDGTLAVARSTAQADKVHGIVTCELDGYDSMGGADQARTFRPGNTSILENEDLKLAWNVDPSDYLGRHHDQPQYNTAVAVTSKLASERFGGYYAAYKDDPSVSDGLKAKLARLAPHDVSATINVAGTTSQEAPIPQATVAVSVMGVDAFGAAQTWATGTYTVDEGTSTTVVSKRLFSASGLAVNGHDTNYGYYLDSIVSPVTGQTLGWDASTGRYWQLFVNSQAVPTGVGGVSLKDGDSVAWCYSAYGDELPATDDRVVTAKIRVVGPDAQGTDYNWLALTELSVPEGTTAAQLTEQALTAAGLAHESSDTTYGYYLATITSPVTGAKLGWDEATGKYWQLFVNGTSSEVGAGSVTLKAGDVITWQYGTYGSGVTNPSDVTVNPSAPRPDYTSEWPNYRGANGGTTTAATPTTGATASWTQSLKDQLGTGMAYANCSDPIIVNGDVYVAVNDTLQIRDASTGKVKATAKLATNIGYFSRIAYADGLVLVPLEDGRLQAVTATTQKPETIWITDSLYDGTDASKAQHAYSSLLIRNNHAYFGTTTAAPGSGGWLVCVDLKDGAVNKVASASGYYWGGAASVGANVLVAEESGRLVLRSASTLGEVSSLELGCEVRSGVAMGADGTTAFVVTLDGVLHKVTVGADGSLSQAGSVKFANYSTSMPTFCDGVVYVGGGTKVFGGRGGLYVIDAATMKVTSSATTLGSGDAIPGDVKSAPLVATGTDGVRVYFTSNGKPGGVFMYKPGDATATLIYLPEESARQYATSSIVAGADGSLYYSNDSSTLFKLAGTSTSPSQELPKEDDKPNAPTNPTNPTNPVNPSNGTNGSGNSNGSGGSGTTNGNGGTTNGGSGTGGRRPIPSELSPSTSQTVGGADASADSDNPVPDAAEAADDALAAQTTMVGGGAPEATTTDAGTTGVGLTGESAQGGIPIWPIIGMCLAVATIVIVLVAKRRRDKDEEA